MKTYSAKPGDINRRWYVVDLAGQTLGRAASRVASVLRGKHRPEFTPHADCGDYIIAINADQVVLKGSNKASQKHYWHHSGYPGGIKGISAQKLMESNPEEVFLKAVRGMLPKNSLGGEVIKKLRVYKGSEHPHQGQQPQQLEL